MLHQYSNTVHILSPQIVYTDSAPAQALGHVCVHTREHFRVPETKNLTFKVSIKKVSVKQSCNYHFNVRKMSRDPLCKYDWLTDSQMNGVWWRALFPETVTCPWLKPITFGPRVWHCEHTAFWKPYVTNVIFCLVIDSAASNSDLFFKIPSSHCLAMSSLQRIIYGKCSHSMQLDNISFLMKPSEWNVRKSVHHLYFLFQSQSEKSHQFSLIKIPISQYSCVLKVAL